MLYEVITSPWAKVVAASATAAYRTGARDVRQVGRDLGVRYLLEGNVRRVGDNLRVTAQLAEAETVITSYSIHYTKLYDRCSPALTQASSNAASGTATSRIGR